MRYLGVGNGGFAGSIGFQQIANYMKRGFAVAGSAWTSGRLNRCKLGTSTLKR